MDGGPEGKKNFGDLIIEALRWREGLGGFAFMLLFSTEMAVATAGMAEHSTGIEKPFVLALGLAAVALVAWGVAREIYLR